MNAFRKQYSTEITSCTCAQIFQNLISAEQTIQVSYYLVNYYNVVIIVVNKN